MESNKTIPLKNKGRVFQYFVKCFVQNIYLNMIDKSIKLILIS